MRTGHTARTPLLALNGTYNANNQLTGTGWAYDGNGNPTSDAASAHGYTWDAEDNLTSLTGGSVPFAAGYLDDGRRAWKSASGTKTYFLYAGTTPVCELDASGNVTAVNTFGSGLISRHTTADTFYTFDPQGNVVQRVTGGGTPTSVQDYTAFGQALTSYGSSAPADPFGYHGAEGYYTDRETGLLYLTHRYYDPTRARFLNRDPMGYDGGINLYGYCGNGPVEGSDPLGLDVNDDDNDPLTTSTNAGSFYTNVVHQGWSGPGGVGEGFADGSQERGKISQFMHQIPILGTILGGTEAATGCDYVGGTHVSMFQRVIGGAGALAAIGPYLGALKRPATQLHHLLPTEFRAQFARIGLDHDDWVISVSKKVHQEFLHGFPQDGMGGWWNQQWRDFFAAHENAGTTPGLWDVMNKMRKMQEIWGLENKTIFRYPERLIRLRDRL